MNILDSIMAERRADVARAKRETPLEALASLARGRVHHGLTQRLAAGGTAVIAEVKKASPSAGLLREDYRPAAIARAYEAAGAAGISVLTEPRRFLGAREHLESVRAAVNLPVLRKDFLCDPYQVAEAAAWGADVVLLIVAALSPRQLRELHAAAGEYGLDTLVEAHTAAELEQALELEGAVLGVNSRDLKTLKTDLATAEALGGRIPAHRVAVAESGIRTREDVARLRAVGYRGFLVGEVLMAASDPAARLRELLGE